MTTGKVDHDVLEDNWKIAYGALGLDFNAEPNSKQLLYLRGTALQSIAHVLVDLRESVDASTKQNETLLRVLSTVLRNQVIQIKRQDTDFLCCVQQLNESLASLTRFAEQIANCFDAIL